MYITFPLSTILLEQHPEGCTDNLHSPRGRVVVAKPNSREAGFLPPPSPLESEGCPCNLRDVVPTESYLMGM